MMSVLLGINTAGVFTGEVVEPHPDGSIPTGYVIADAAPVLGAGQYAIAGAYGRMEVRTGTPSAPYVEKVTRRQFLQGLTRIGLREQVDTWRAALDLTKPADRDMADWYDASLHFERANPQMQDLATSFGMTTAQVDEAFAMMDTL